MEAVTCHVSCQAALNLKIMNSLNNEFSGRQVLELRAAQGRKPARAAQEKPGTFDRNNLDRLTSPSGNLRGKRTMEAPEHAVSSPKKQTMLLDNTITPRSAANVAADALNAAVDEWDAFLVDGQELSPVTASTSGQPEVGRNLGFSVLQ